MKRAPYIVLLVLLATMIGGLPEHGRADRTPGAPRRQRRRPAAAATVTLTTTGPATATPKPSATTKAAATPALPAVALPAEFMDARTDSPAAVAAGATGHPHRPRRRWRRCSIAPASKAGRPGPSAPVFNLRPTARLLCLTPYVAVVHYSSPLEELSADRLRAILQGKDWTGQVFYSGDPALCAASPASTASAHRSSPAHLEVRDRARRRRPHRPGLRPLVQRLTHASRHWASRAARSPPTASRATPSATRGG